MAAPPNPPNIIDVLDSAQSKDWLKKAARAAQIAALAFSVNQDKLHHYVLLSTKAVEPVREFLFGSPDIQGQPFCDAQIGEDIRLQALYFGQCVHAILISVPILAYFRKECSLRIREYNSFVKAKIVTILANNDERNTDSLHSVIFLSPSFMPTGKASSDSTTTFTDPGVIVDPSARQMGYTQTFYHASDYVSAYFDHDKEHLDLHENAPPGTHARRIRDHDAMNGTCPGIHDLERNRFRQEASIRAVCSILFRQLEARGGAKELVGLDEQGWTLAIASLRHELEKGLEELRERLDGIEFSRLSEEDKRCNREELISLYTDDGYTKMMGLI